MQHPDREQQSEHHINREVQLRWKFYQLMTFLFGFKAELENPEALGNIPTHALLAGYPHTSHLDTAAIQLILGQQHAEHQSVVVKKRYWSGLRGKALRMIFEEDRVLPVEKEDVGGLKQLATILKERRQTSTEEWVIIYPQGTRESDAAAAEGTAFLARFSGMEIVPIIVTWSEPVLLKKNSIPAEILIGLRASLTGKRRSARVHIGPTITVTGKRREHIHQELMSYYQNFQTSTAKSTAE